MGFNDLSLTSCDKHRKELLIEHKGPEEGKAFKCELPRLDEQTGRREEILEDGRVSHL